MPLENQSNPVSKSRVAVTLGFVEAQRRDVWKDK